MPERPFADVCSGAVTTSKLPLLQLPQQAAQASAEPGLQGIRSYWETRPRAPGAEPCGGSGPFLCVRHSSSAASGGSGEVLGSSALTCQVQLQRARCRSTDQRQFGHHHVWGVGI